MGWVGIKRCDNNGDFLNGIRLKSEEGYLKKETEEAEKSLDETAANNVDMKLAQVKLWLVMECFGAFGQAGLSVLLDLLSAASKLEFKNMEEDSLMIQP